MAKVKVKNTSLDPNLNGSNFMNIPSQTIFSFGRFNVTSNFDGRKQIDYNHTLSSFVRAVTLETMGVSTTQSEFIYEKNNKVVLNLDKSDLNTFIRFGSAYEFLRVSVEKIILNYPYSLFINSQISRNNNITVVDYIYDLVTDTCTFKVPVNGIVNNYNFVYNYGNISHPDDKEIKNLNLSYDKYVIWTSRNPSENFHNIIGYTGNTSSRSYLLIKAMGNPFTMLTNSSASIDFHIKPNNFVFEEFRESLSDYEKNILTARQDLNGFEFKLKDPVLLDDGNIIFSDAVLLWSTTDKYNIDINTPNYRKFFEILLTIGGKYDRIKTDLIARFLTTSSLKTYDLTEDGKITKLLRIYGREFDQLREFIDALAYINKVSYDKVNNIPDQLIMNMSRTFGWDYFSLVNETELVESFLTIDSDERNLTNDLMPAEIDIELWRRIMINTNYFWKTKGTREAIKSMFLLIGIPEPFINITEYVYTVEGRIDPRTVRLTQDQFPSNSLPYDNSGYPVAPLETPKFYFQTSGDTDSGQAYMNVFRSAGFNIMRTIDNKKTWSQSGSTFRVDDTTPQYYQEDSRLVLNTKEVDVALDTARGIEYDVYSYIQKDFTINSSGYTLPYSYVNISLGVDGIQNTFPLPVDYSVNKVLGNLEVRFNGILLNAPSFNNTGNTTNSDYTIDEVSKTFTLTNGMNARNNTSRRDVIQATFVYSGGTHSLSGITVEYIVTRINANDKGTGIPLPENPAGDVQVTINGIALTKGTPQFAADYIIGDYGVDEKQLVIQNQDLIAYLRSFPEVQVAFVKVIGSDDILARTEILRVDSFNSNKLYFNQSANKYVYRLNYKANSAKEIKVLIDGIALEPNRDYSINVQNSYEVFLPKGIKYGTVISVYYLVGGNAVFQPVVKDVFGVGDISKLSFLEFMEMIQRRMINARNRKTIGDFEGGWYPSLYRIYAEYIRRSSLSEDNPLRSNGYSFQNLYSFLSKYNAFFQRFVDQLLPATIILKKGGLMIRNSTFTKQKFMYRRGVNLLKPTTGNTTTGDIGGKIVPIYDMRNNFMIYYLGHDGGIFKINQTASSPPPPPPVLYVETIEGNIIEGDSGIELTTGGINIINNSLLTQYGVYYRRWYDHIIDINNEGIEDIEEMQFKAVSPGEGMWGNWHKIYTNSSLPVNNFKKIIPNVGYSTTYEYKAYVQSNIYGYTGNTISTQTPEAPVIPSLKTISGSSDQSTIGKTGGFEIVNYENADYYGMQYRYVGSDATDISISPTMLSYGCCASSRDVSITGDSWNAYTISKNPSLSWIIPAAPVSPSPTGALSQICVTNNFGSARSGVVCYVPTFGTTKCVTVNQCSSVEIINKSVSIETTNEIKEPLVHSINACIIAPEMVSGETFAATFTWSASNPTVESVVGNTHCVEITCNSTSVYSCTHNSSSAYNFNAQTNPILVKSGDVIGLYVYADSPIISSIPSTTCLALVNIASNGTFKINTETSNYIKAETDTL